MLSIVARVFGMAAPLLFATGSWASDENCQDTLVREIYTNRSSRQDDHRLSTLVTSESWTEARNKSGASGKLFGTTIGGSYDDYKASAQSSLSRRTEQETHSEVLNIAWTGLDSGASKRYQDCLRFKLMSSDGLQAAVIGATESDIAILVHYHVTGDARAVRVEWSPPSLGGTMIQQSIPSGYTTIRVPRPTATVTLAGNYRGYTTQNIVLTPLPPLLIDVPSTTDCRGRHIVRAYNNWPALSQDIDPVERGDSERQVNAQARRGFYYAAGAGRHWGIDVSSSNWYAPPGGEIVDGSVRIERVDASNEISGYSAAKTGARSIDLYFQSNTGGAPRSGVAFAVYYTYRTTSRCEPAMVQ